MELLLFASLLQLWTIKIFEESQNVCHFAKQFWYALESSESFKSPLQTLLDRSVCKNSLLSENPKGKGQVLLSEFDSRFVRILVCLSTVLELGPQ